MKTTTLRISVTARDIANGLKDHCSKCPVALAITRRTKKPPHVGRYTLSFDKNGGAYFLLPEVARNFIEKYDARKCKYEPFSFNLEIPARLVKKRLAGGGK